MLLENRTTEIGVKLVRVNAALKLGWLRCVHTVNIVPQQVEETKTNRIYQVPPDSYQFHQLSRSYVISSISPPLPIISTNH